MFRKILQLSLIIGAALLSDAESSAQVSTTGRVALGVFMPTGSDADVAETSVALQLTGDVQMVGRLGVEAEFSWIPINLDETARPAGHLVEARQVSALAGFRISTESVRQESARPVAYVSGRVGFSRIAVKADTTASAPGWIGSTVDATQNLPPFSFPIRATENAFVIAPRAGILLRPTSRALIDISLSPYFLFDNGEVTTQIMATVGFGLLGHLD